MTFDLESRQEGVIHVFFQTKLQRTQSVQVVVRVLSKYCLAPTFVRAKQVKYVGIRTHKCSEIKA
jgi:hypothetical protein